MEATLAAIGAPIGTVVGSYVTTAALRATRGEASIMGRSHCDRCGVPLGFGRTVPLWSFLAQRGACVTCGGAIDPAHPVGELAGGLLVALALVLTPAGTAPILCAVGFVLLAASVIDARTQRLPDGLVLLTGASALVLAARHGASAMVEGVISAGVAFLILQGLRRVVGRGGRDPGLGLGDVKLICALALWLGTLTAAMVVIAAVLGLIWIAVRRPAHARIAFGPMIAAAGWGLGVMMESGRWLAIA